MKKIFYLFSIFFYAYQFSSQCIISGNENVLPNSESKFSVSTELAQCQQCFRWTFQGSGMSISSDNRLNSIQLKSEKMGKGLLSLTILSPNGVVTCAKEVSSFSGNTSTMNNLNSTQNISQSLQTNEYIGSQNLDSDCDIRVNNFKEVKVSENIVSFFPNENNSTLKYKWTVQYSDGSTMSANESIPQFPVTLDKEITSVNLSMSSGKCLRKFTKSYEKNYWKFLK